VFLYLLLPSLQESTRNVLQDVLFVTSPKTLGISRNHSAMSLFLLRLELLKAVTHM
jgi:hypothetical protein